MSNFCNLKLFKCNNFVSYFVDTYLNRLFIVHKENTEAETTELRAHRLLFVHWFTFTVAQMHRVLDISLIDLTSCLLKSF